MSDVETIRRFIRLVKEPGELIELRADHNENNRKRRYNGYYDDHDKFAFDAAEFGGNCFFTVNQIDPAIPATNELQPARRGGCTSAENIVRRTLLYLDADVVREKGQPSTDEQHAAAVAMVKRIVEHLQDADFPQPVIGSSGNGSCAFWAIDLDPDSTVPKCVLKAIKKQFELPTITVDLRVADRARVGRLLGTDNCKGDRIGRQTVILGAPDELEVLSEATMLAFAPLPKTATEADRVQQVVTGWTFGKTYGEQVANIRTLLTAKEISHSFHEDRDKTGAVCGWFHFDCVLRPGHKDSKNWIKIHPTEGVSGGCHHGKCAGKGLQHILGVIAPELAAEAAEAYDDSYRLARGFLRSRPPLVVWQDAPHGYRDGVYVEEPEASVKAALSLHIKRAFDALGFEVTPNVTTSIVHNAYQAAAATCYDRAESAPHWRNRNGHPNATEYLLFRNGLLHVPSYLDGKSDCLTAPTPDYFALAKLPYNFDPSKAATPLFDAFCKFQWDDPNVRLLLEEALGDVLMSDTRRRVFYAFLGKGGAGKSALVQGAFEGMVGADNCCAIEMANFAKDFGLQGAVGKKLILVAEAGTDSRYTSATTEKIKQITGDDLIAINRKNKPILSVRLGAKIIIVSNHPPKFPDHSGALFDRLIPIQFTRKVEDPDPAFPDKLRDELPGIVLLALKGWTRLRDKGRFTMPEASKRLLAELRETGSPVQTFVDKRCVLDKYAFTATDDLFLTWQRFCNDTDLPAGTRDHFLDALKSACPEILKNRRTVNKAEVRGFVGIKVLES